MLNGTDAYQKAALFGLALYFVAAITVLIAILILEPAEAAFGVFLLVPWAIAVVAVRFLRRWGLLIGALLSAFGIFIFLADAGLVLTTPEAFFDFLLTLFVLTGLSITLVACLVGFVKYFSGAVAGEIAPNVRTALLGIAGVATALVLVSLVLTIINANQTVSAEERGNALEVIAHHTEWQPEQLTAPAGNVRVFVKNEDPILHTFTVKDSAKGIDIDLRIGAWGEEVVDLGTLSAGVYGFICRVEGHEELMTGAITVR